MLAELKQGREKPEGAYVLFLFPDLETIPEKTVLDRIMGRKQLEIAELADKPVVADNGEMRVWAMVDPDNGEFEKATLLRKALAPILEEEPAKIAIAVYGSEMEKRKLAELALYVAWINGCPLSSRKKKQPKRLEEIELFGFEGDLSEIRAACLGNFLARDLTALPPNELTPGIYREKIAELAHNHGWTHAEYGLDRLHEMGAGAFCAVAQGSLVDDAAIVHLAYRPESAKKRVSLVGKGICFDTGGHNLKPARYMHGMHEDMNGSAVALGILLAASEAKLDIAIDCWLAIAQNHISPKAYKQNDVVTALNGTTIEIVHTDAEGRMVLADALTLASREHPDLVIDFATLTGSMAVALGSRYSGVLGNSEKLLEMAVAWGKSSGERLCAFPSDADYGKDLESDVADIRQCTLEGDADHILAVRFLDKFVEKDVPWLHLDLSASNCKGGLGAVSTDITGFGVKWGTAFLRSWANQ
ncbi:MAG: M17 family metallopeptidase [Burkholderiales bacterium]